MGEDMPANDTWKMYLATDDITKTAEMAAANGAHDHLARRWPSATWASSWS